MSAARRYPSLTEGERRAFGRGFHEGKAEGYETGYQAGIAAAERPAERAEREHWFQKMVTLLDDAYGEDAERIEAAVAAAGGPPLGGSEDEYDRLAQYVRDHP